MARGGQQRRRRHAPHERVEPYLTPTPEEEGPARPTLRERHPPRPILAGGDPPRPTPTGWPMQPVDMGLPKIGRHLG